MGGSCRLGAAGDDPDAGGGGEDDGLTRLGGTGGGTSGPADLRPTVGDIRGDPLIGERVCERIAQGYCQCMSGKSSKKLVNCQKGLMHYFLTKYLLETLLSFN